MDKRSAERRTTIYHSELRDPCSGELVGHLVDVSRVGLRFTCSESVKPGTEMELMLRLPSMILGREEHVFQGIVRWCRPDVNPDYWAVGMEIDAEDTRTARILGSIQRQYCFSD